MLEIVQTHPRISIVVAAILVSLFISLVNYFVLDKEKTKKMKERQKEIRHELKIHKNDPAKSMELNKELMSQTMENMKSSFKPMVITLIPTLVVIWWLRSAMSTTSISGTWLWWYIGGAIVASLIFRKLFKLP